MASGLPKVRDGPRWMGWQRTMRSVREADNGFIAARDESRGGYEATYVVDPVLPGRLGVVESKRLSKTQSALAVPMRQAEMTS